METALLLSRMQFALNISFHILFPTINIALCWLLFYFKVRHDISGNPVWMRAYRFWVKIFALTFALGVVSGITMSFQFGTNWPDYMETVGNIAGPLLGYEVLTAFFLEATFLGVMLFGIKRVQPKIHTLSTLIVSLGTTLSAFWILALNSWMHTPAGFELINGVAHVVDWYEVIFNPSFPYRLLHMLCASGLTVAFFVAGISAYRLLNGDQKQAPLLSLKTAIVIAAILTPIQIFIGDLHGLNTFKHQPAKIAAMEAVWHTKEGAPLVLFAYPDKATKSNTFEVSLPKLASVILTHDPNGEIQGLNEFGEEIPPVAPVFFSFRIMLAVGMLMLITSWFALATIIRKKPFTTWQLKILSTMTFSGWIATLAGWYVTEVGRQPWLVTGILKTSEAVTQLQPSYIGLSFILYLSLYSALLVAYILTVRLMARRSVNVEEFELANTLRGATHV